MGVRSQVATALGGAGSGSAPSKKSGPSKRAPRAPRPSSRVLVEECPVTMQNGKPVPVGLCGPCGWQGKKIPRAWLDEKPGTPYPGASKLLGTEVTLRGDDRPSTVAGVATPVGGGVFGANRSKRYQCQGSFVVRTPLGRGHVDTVLPRSVVRERQRTREGNCPDAMQGGIPQGMIRAIDREAARGGRHPFDVSDQEPPFPHRKGSTPCCGSSSVAPAKLDALLEAWTDSGEESDFERLAAAVRRALPKHLRATLPLESRAEVVEAIRAVRDHCWGQWLTKEEREKEGRKGYQRRKAAAQKDRKLRGLDTGGRSQRRTTFLDDIAEVLG
jgi:hypothetical protein